jgi:putative ABC transport system ATP-binding protein
VTVPRLEFRDVSRSFEDGARATVLALRPTSFTLARGECLRVLGPSGAGKSTLLALSCGLLLPTSGEVLLDGEPFSRWRESFRAAARRRRLSVVVQGLSLVTGMTALENVLLPMVPDGLATRAARERAESWLARLGVSDVALSKVELLSGGERQRVALARALASTHAELIVLDEPSAHLDAARTAALVEALRERLDAGASLLIATHDPRLDSLGSSLELAPREGAP